MGEDEGLSISRPGVVAAILQICVDKCETVPLTLVTLFRRGEARLGCGLGGRAS